MIVTTRMLPSITVRWLTFAIVLGCIASRDLAFAQSQNEASALSIGSADRTFFENRIRPVLVEKCHQCHSPGADKIGGRLTLDSLQSMLKGGESGAAITPGKPDESLIIHALSYDGLQMPPDEQLPDSVINDFREWIQRGAPFPESTQPAASPATIAPGDSKVMTTADSAPSNSNANIDHEALWSYRAPDMPAVPHIKDEAWAYDEIDRFVLAKIEAAGMQPLPDADARTLLRRVYFDLTGLPPTFEQTEYFEQRFRENQTAALSDVVDELLSSPAFGERWARHWLDVARYAESNGNDGLGRNPTFPHAWRYRDYVIQAFNHDLPYNQFLTEQIAGDLLPAENDEQRDRFVTATGFLALSAKPAKAMNDDFAMDVVADQIDVITRGVMGISVACARCHDHKFDPIPTTEYYALAGMFTSTETLWGMAGHEGLSAPSTDLHVLKTAPHIKPPEDFVETVFVIESDTGIPKKPPKPRWPLGTPLAMGVRDIKEPADCKLNIKGDSKKLGDVVPRGFVAACNPAADNLPQINAAESGRKQLAEWLTHPRHPQTSRVFVNRIWQHLFGEGIVRTPDEFGVYGERPTHPELLDFLAIRFIEDGWSVKKLIRKIVLSHAYQTATADTSEMAGLLAGHRRRRLDAESLRDSMLLVSGQLDRTPGSGSVIQHRDILVNLAGNLHQPVQKRSIFLAYLRSSPPPELAAFDLPDFSTVLGKRDVSTVPGQTLYLFNNPFVLQQAEHFAQRVISGTSEPSEQIRLAFRLAYGREVADMELKEAGRLIDLTGAPSETKTSSIVLLCQGLLISNEFRYID